MVVDHGVVHPRVDVIHVVRQNRVPGEHIYVDSRRRLERLPVDAKAAEIANDEADELFRAEAEPCHAILRVAFECHAISEHARKKCIEQHARISI